MNYSYQYHNHIQIIEQHYVLSQAEKDMSTIIPVKRNNK
jgi:hypothetical protein